MKNPFVMMAMMAAAMSAAFRENAYRDAGMALPKSKSRSRIAGKANPAGTKLLMRAYRAKHGQNADSVQEAREWYAGYLKDMDARARFLEAEKRKARAERNAVPLKLAA